MLNRYQITKERAELISAGFKVPTYLPFSDFKTQWYSISGHEISDAILKEFWEDYLTSNCSTVEEYYDLCSKKR